MNDKVCLICGNKIIKQKTYSKKYWGKRKFCSSKCYWDSLVGRNLGGIVLTKCLTCGKEFNTGRHLIKRGLSKYCSRKCVPLSDEQFRNSRGLKKKTILICKQCKKEFSRGHLKAKFCSISCKNKYQQGENHPSWKGGRTNEYNKFKQSKEYKQWRKNIFERDDYTCRECGFKSGNGIHIDLHPHHIKSASKFIELRLEPSNGKTLCARCHGKAHGTNFKDYYKKFGGTMLGKKHTEEWKKQNGIRMKKIWEERRILRKDTIKK